MLTTEKIGKANFSIAQMKKCLDNDLLKHEHNTTFIFEKLNNSDSKVVATKYLQLYNQKWIGNTALHFAVDKRDLQAIDILLRHGANVTIKNSTGSTALHKIIENLGTAVLEENTLANNYVFISLILSAHLKNHNLENPTNTNGLSHFHIASAANNVISVREFLRSGVTIDHTVKVDCSLFAGFSPLHFTAKYCAFEAAEVLLSHGANVRIKDAKGMLPLHVALERKLKMTSEICVDEVARDQNEKLLELFLEKERSNDTRIVDNFGLSHFQVACTLRDSKIAKRLLPEVSNMNHAVNMDSPLWSGYTALHFAALCNLGTVELLMRKGADVSIKDSKGVTPLDICVERYKAEDISAILSLDPTQTNVTLADGKTKLTDLVSAMRSSSRFSVFLERHDKNSQVSNSAVWSGCTPMHLAVIFSKELSSDREEVNLQILRQLFERDPSALHARDIHGRTPLHLAFRLGKKSAVDRLLDFHRRHANSSNLADEDGLSYAHIASAANDVFLLETILSIGADVNAVYKGKPLVARELSADLADENRSAYTHIASVPGNVSSLERMLSAGGDARKKGNPPVSHLIHPGATALHFAVVHASVEAAVELLRRGADARATDAYGMTPVHWILARRDDRLARALLYDACNWKDCVAPKIGLSYLLVACLCGAYRPAAELLRNGADAKAVVADLQATGGLPFLERYAGRSLLFVVLVLASIGRRGMCGTLSALLAAGADVRDEEIAPLYWIFEGSNCRDPVIEILENRVGLRDRLKADTGMTQLHVACFTLEAGEIERLIGEGADVNAPIRSDSPIFRGYTPFHALLHACREVNQNLAIGLIKLFVKSGAADVTLQSGKSETVIHMAYKLFGNWTGRGEGFRESTLLEAQRDFSVNPVSVEGLSHFHIACSLCNVNVVREFLLRADVDVDQATDFFYPDAPGRTALHLAARGTAGLDVASDQLETVDLLLKHGADVRAEDALGDTALHASARLNCLDVFQSLARRGADVNARNSHGDTPLSCFLDASHFSGDKMRILLTYGCHLNTFNPVTGKGYMGATIFRLPYPDVYNLLSAIIVNFEHELKRDNQGCTAIHNIVSADPPTMSDCQYAELIDKLSRAGCDVDDQDHSGRTALHAAVKFHNFKAIYGLLLAGADINVTDAAGETALAHQVCKCQVCETSGRNAIDSNKIIRQSIFKILAAHVIKLQLCGLDANNRNKELASKAFEELTYKTMLTDKFFKELAAVKNTAVASHSLTLGDFLSETGAVADYPRMSLVKRNAVDKFFSTGELKSFREKFPDSAGILQMQYRKFKARPSLLELAEYALTILVGFKLPEICSDCILMFLTNSELKSLISSAY